MDIFKEQMVAVNPNGKTKMKKTIIIVVAVIAAVLGMMFGGAFIGPLLVVGLIFGGSYLTKAMNLEYEYILTNSELDVDKIMNKERRKKFLSLDLKEINLMAHIDDGARKPDFERAQKTIDISSGEKGPNTYVIVFMHKNELTKLIMEPNEEMQQLMFKKSPSKVHLQRY